MKKATTIGDKIYFLGPNPKAEMLACKLDIIDSKLDLLLYKKKRIKNARR